VDAKRASSVDNMLGIQSDFDYGNLSSVTEMVRQMKFAGIETMRVNVTTDPGKLSDLNTIAANGIKLEFLADTGMTPAANASAIAKFAASHAGSIKFAEGPNEPNNFDFSYAGKTGNDAAVAWQNAFFNAMNANATTKDIPVYGVISWPNINTAADLNNLHPYPNNGDQPRQTIINNINDQNAVEPGKPFGITEMGYFTLPGDNSNGVSDAVQAKLMVNAYMDAVSLGAQHVGLYSLRDWPASDGGAHYGIFYNNNTAKPAANALHNIETLLSDGAANAGTFTTAPLDVTVSAPSDVRTMLMQKASGDYVMAVWREPDIWDQNLDRAITASSVNVNLTFAKAANLAEYDPIAGSAAVRTATGANNFSFGLIDHAVFVEVKAGAVAPSQPPPAHAPASITVGSGADSLVLRINEDAWDGDAQYVVKVDGRQIGGTLTASALHSSGQYDTVTIKGDWAAGSHGVDITFLNDANGGAGMDRNLYVLDGATYDGRAVSGEAANLYAPVAAHFSFTDIG
jgi:hypothetical protein